MTTKAQTTRPTEIPSAWLMGMTHRGRVAEAVAYWLEQERMAAHVGR